MAALRFSLSLATGLLLIASAAADEVRGLIVRIDPDRHHLQLEARGPRRGAMLDLTVGPKTQVHIGGQRAALGDLAPGRRIRVVFEQRDGKPVALEIRAFGLGLLAPRPAPAPAPAADLPVPRKAGEGVTGTLQRVALTDREVVVIGPGDKGPQTETTIAVPEKTSITRDGKPIALEALKEGETVTVKTEMRKDQPTALSIQVGQATATTAPAMTPRRNVVPRLRQALKLADELLRELEEQRPPTPDRP
jgi:cold shock CspA family protein